MGERWKLLIAIFLISAIVTYLILNADEIKIKLTIDNKNIIDYEKNKKNSWFIVAEYFIIIM